MFFPNSSFDSLFDDRQQIQENLEKLDACIRTDRDMNLVIIALVALREGRDLPKKIPSEFVEKIRPLQKIYEEFSGRKGQDQELKSLFKASIQRKINNLKVRFNIPLETALMKQAILTNETLTLLETLPVRDQRAISRFVAHFLDPKGNLTEDLAQDLAEASKTLSGTNVSLQAVIELAKPLFTEAMDVGCKGGLIKDLAKDLAEASKALSGTNVSLQAVIELAKPLFTEAMDVGCKGG